MEIPDSTNDCEVESKSRASPEETEERLFVSSLYSFMKGRNTPIERIPHLGFKQINLWKIYKAVEKLGGYDSATARRLWKNVYDELGGSPGSTSAATCTRRHYERLLLPFERQLRGEEDKPLPPSKPRKQYKRSLDAKISKSEGKKKRTQSEKEMDSETQTRPESASECETATRLPSVTWPDRPHPEQPEPDIPSQRPSVYPQCSVQPVLSPYPWPTNIASAAGEVISPLEKKKRMAQQASLHHPQPQSPSQEGGKERPSVIHRSPSPDLAPPSRPSSAGSPLPVSSSSSRSPSPYSISSDDCAALADERPSATSKPDSPLVHSGSFTPVSGCRGSGEPHSHSSSSTKASRKDHRDFPVFCSQVRDTSQVNSSPVDTTRGHTKDYLWSPVPKESSRYATHEVSPAPLTTPGPYTVTSIWVPGSSSSFTKVPPKTVVPLRPIPHQPGYKLPQSRSNPCDDTMANAKKLNHMAPRLLHTEKKEKSRTVIPKPRPQSMLRFPMLPVSYLFPAYDRTGREYRPSLPILLPSQIRPPPLSLPMYRHVTMGPDRTNPAFDPIPYTNPHSFPVWNPHHAYNLTGVTSHYPHRM